MSAGKPPALFRSLYRVKPAVHYQVGGENKAACDYDARYQQKDDADANKRRDKEVGKYYIEISLSETVDEHVKVRCDGSGCLYEHHLGSVLEDRQQQKVIEECNQPHECCCKTYCSDLEEVLHVKGQVSEVTSIHFILGIDARHR